MISRTSFNNISSQVNFGKVSPLNEKTVRNMELYINSDQKRKLEKHFADRDVLLIVHDNGKVETTSLDMEQSCMMKADSIEEFLKKANDIERKTRAARRNGEKYNHFA